jgi:hypothetical protein
MSVGDQIVKAILPGQEHVNLSIRFLRVPKREDECIFFSDKLFHPRRIQNGTGWDWRARNQSQLIEGRQEASQIVRVERNRDIQVESHSLDTVQHDRDSSGNNKINSMVLERAEDLDQMTFLGTLCRSHIGLNHGRGCESRDALAASNFFDGEPTLCYVSLWRSDSGNPCYEKPLSAFLFSHLSAFVSFRYQSAPYRN